MNPQIMDALVQTINEAINSKVKSLKDDLIGSIANEQRRHLIQLSKTAVKSEIMDLGTSLRAVIEEQVKNIPAPKDGEPGKDATSEQIAEAVTAWMVANFVQPKDGIDGQNGQDGKDGVSVSVEDVKELAEGWLSKNIQQPVNGSDGKDGLNGSHGKDAADIDVLPAIDENKSYPKGTWASYKGGLIKSIRDTHPIGEKSLLESGWDIVVQGIQAIEVHPLDDGEFAIKSVLTGGQDHITKMAIPAMVYKGVWKESNGAYKKGHTVTQSGSLWVCLKATETKPGSSDDWQLAAKRGTDGRDGKDLNVVKLNKPETYKLGGV